MNRTLYLASVVALTLMTGTMSSLAGFSVGQAAAAEPSTSEPPKVEPPFCKIVGDEEEKKPDDKTAAADDKAQPNSTATAPGGAASSPESAAAANQAAAVEAAKPKLPKLRQTLQATCAGDKIKLQIDARFFGWRVGDETPIEFQLFVPKDVAINPDTLKQKKLAISDSFKTPFEMSRPPIILSKKTDAGVEYDIVVYVRQFTIESLVAFSMQFPYAVEFAADGSPKWQVFTTPEYMLANSIDGGFKDMKRAMAPGNTEGVKPRTPGAVPGLTIIIVLLMAPWLLIGAMRYVNRTRSPKSMSREAAGWLAMHEVVKSGKKIGFGSTHYNRMSEVLRIYLEPTYPGLKGMTRSEIEALPDEAHANLVKSVFRKLDRVLVDERPLSAAEKTQLISEVDQLIKRPYTM